MAIAKLFAICVGLALLGCFAWIGDARAEAGNSSATADTPVQNTTGKKKRKFRRSTKVDFSAQSVEGKLRRPETSLITASEESKSNGLLRLRENFLDRMAMFAGEEVK